MNYETLGVWEFDRDTSPEIAARVAVEQSDAPDLEVLLLMDRGDVITVQVVEGALAHPDALLYVETRGLHHVLRVEKWPALQPGSALRVLLTLSTWRPLRPTAR